MKFKVKYLFGLPVVLYLLLNLSGCFQFRMSHKKAIKYFKTAQPPIVFKNILVGHKKRNIHYAETLDSTKPYYILFVHGSPGSGSNLYAYLKDTNLTKLAQVASMDRPGYGYSTFGRGEPLLAKQAEAVESIIKQHQTQQVILVGHSLGGPIIAKAAMLYPNLVDGLFIIAGSVDPSLEPKESWRKPLNRAWIKWLMPRSFKVSNEEIIPLKPQLEEMDTCWNKVLCPVYVLQGQKDKLVSEGNADYLAKKLPEHQLIVIKLKDANHFIPFSKQPVVVEHILQFLNNYGKKEE